MKLAKSCLQCREAKRKCDLSQDEACSPCTKRNTPCSFERASKIRSPRILAPTIARDSKHDVRPYDVLSIEATLDLVERYIEYVHDKPHSLFHQPTLRQAVRDRTIRPVVLCGICGIGARFSDDPKIKEMSQCLADHAKQLLHQDLDNACVDNIQACILISSLCSSVSQIRAEALYIGQSIQTLSCAAPDLHRNCDSHGAIDVAQLGQPSRHAHITRSEA